MRPRRYANVKRDGRQDGRPRHHRASARRSRRIFTCRGILSGEDYWCQGYSEPGSGSDLASLKTRAVRDGDDYIINGTKIWTTHAHHANRMFALVRTNDTDASRTASASS
jgi:alkylation response protein AidB-like acyl-CoA dehydrogenase